MYLCVQHLIPYLPGTRVTKIIVLHHLILAKLLFEYLSDKKLGVMWMFRLFLFSSTVQSSNSTWLNTCIEC